MAKKILLIENDQTLAGQLSDALDTSGFEVRATGDGKEGLDLARDWAPEAIVLCVELPGMSGYLVCQKLKKDEGLKAIPLVLTSAEATQETFEKHRTLKARADEYLLKPYDPDALVEKLGALIGLPEGAAALAVEEGEEELVSLEEEIGIGAADGEPGAEIPGLDLESLPDEPSAGASGGALDEDLQLLDDAFDGISASPAAAREASAALDELAAESPMAVDEVDAAEASLPEEDDRAARADLGALDGEDDDAFGALAGMDETRSPRRSFRDGAPAAPPPSAPSRAAPLRGASADLLRAAGIKLLGEEPPPLRGAAFVPPPPGPASAGGADPAELAAVRAALEDARVASARAQGALAARDVELRDARRDLEDAGRRADDAEAELADANGRATAAEEKARKAEADLRAARDEARRAADQARAAEAELQDLRLRVSDAERRATDAEKRTDDAETRAVAAEEDARRKAEEAAAAAEALSRAEALERETDELRTELLVARGEAEGARGEIERRTAELTKRAAELEAANAKNEERVVKAYQKIKADEKARDKVRKALSIAAQLLDEGLAAESPAEKERRAAAAAATAGRE